MRASGGGGGMVGVGVGGEVMNDGGLTFVGKVPLGFASSGIVSLIHSQSCTAVTLFPDCQAGE